MHAAAFLMCAMIAGADVRDKIATPQALSDLMLRNWEPTAGETWQVLEKGAALQVTVESKGAAPWTATGKLKVLPCPGHPNLILASYLFPESDVSKAQAYPGLTGFTALIDVDRNLIAAAYKRSQLDFSTMPAAQVSELIKQIEGFGKSYVELISADPQKYGVRTGEAALKSQFIDPPEITTTIDLTDFNYPNLSFSYRIKTVAGDRGVTYKETFRFDDLLKSELAIPAEQYFAKSPTQEKVE